MKVVIIGGVAGGASAAARLRRLDEYAEIIIIERSGFVSYANCGLPYFIGNTITDREKLTLQTPESFLRRFAIDVRTRNEAIRIDRESHEVVIRNLETGNEYSESYDKLILSPGAKALVPQIPGVDSERLFTVRTVEDTYAISDFIERENPKSAAVIGGGFIGVEMAENLVDRGISVTLYQRPKQLLPILDADMVPFVHNHMREKGVSLRFGADVTSFSDTGSSIAVTNRMAGESSSAEYDMAILAIGVTPESSLAEAAGLERGIKDAIVVDNCMRTSDPDIYAVGDVVQVNHVVTGGAAHIALAGPANKQGRIAADNICGIPSTYDGSLGSSVLKVFELSAASTGLTAARAEREGIDASFVLLSPPSHASYYPGSSALRLKVVFDKATGRVLGAQAIGSEGVEKRIDVLATAIKAGMTVRDLEDLDLCYAPPFSSAKDPVNMAGFMASNILDGLVEQVSWTEAGNRSDNEILLDVRTSKERDRGSVDGSLHIPVDELRGRLDELPFGKRILVHCQTGLRSYLACRILAQRGFDCANVAGGYIFYDVATHDFDARNTDVGPCGL